MFSLLVRSTSQNITEVSKFHIKKYTIVYLDFQFGVELFNGSHLLLAMV